MKIDTLVPSVKLPLRFDPAVLEADLDRIPGERWTAHFNTGDYEGDWSAVALRGPAGAVHPIQEIAANPGTGEWADTELVAACPAFAQVMGTFRCPLHSVRLLRLAPGAVIREHTDHSLSFADGEVRIHLPVRTSSAVRFHLNGELVPLQAGDVWYLNVNLPHSVENRGPEPRVHLVLDCEVNDWLLGLAGLRG